MKHVSDKDRFISILAGTISGICNRGLMGPSATVMRIDGLLGVTLSNNEVFLVNIREQFSTTQNNTPILVPPENSHCIDAYTNYQELENNWTSNVKQRNFRNANVNREAAKMNLRKNERISKRATKRARDVDGHVDSDDLECSSFNDVHKFTPVSYVIGGNVEQTPRSEDFYTVSLANEGDAQGCSAHQSNTNYSFSASSKNDISNFPENDMRNESENAKHCIKVEQQEFIDDQTLMNPQVQ